MPNKKSVKRTSKRAGRIPTTPTTGTIQDESRKDDMITKPKVRTAEDRVTMRKRLGALYEFIGEDHSTPNVTLVFERISDKRVFTVDATKLTDNKGVRVPDHVRDRLV